MSKSYICLNIAVLLVSFSYVRSADIDISSSISHSFKDNTIKIPKKESIYFLKTDSISKSKNSNVLKLFGFALVIGGFSFSTYSYIQEKVIYKQYKKSAFTFNTDRLREHVEKYSLFKYIGFGIAGSGIVVVVLSF